MKWKKLKATYFAEIEDFEGDDTNNEESDEEEG